MWSWDTEEPPLVRRTCHRPKFVTRLNTTYPRRRLLVTLFCILVLSLRLGCLGHAVTSDSSSPMLLPVNSVSPLRLPLHIPAAGPSWDHLPRNRRVSTRSVEDWCDGQMLPLQRYRSIRAPSTTDPLMMIQSAAAREGRQQQSPTFNNDDFLEQIIQNPSGYNLSKTSLFMMEQLESLDSLQRDQLIQKIRVEQQASQPVPLEALEILYVDASICVVNKPSGILSVPGPRRNPSLANLVYETLQPPGVDLDQMVVHRLDMATSGILVYALSLEALSKLHADFKDRRVQKTYQALVRLPPRPRPSEDNDDDNSSILSTHSTSIMEGEIDVDLERDPENPPFMRIARPKTPLNDNDDETEIESTEAAVGKIGPSHKFYKQAPKESLTTWTLLSREIYQGQAVARLELRPWTGRTHQLRVHCAQALGTPIVGDDIYGHNGNGNAGNSGCGDDKNDDDDVDTQKSPLCLHARQLCIHHPVSGAPMIFEADPPF